MLKHLKSGLLKLLCLSMPFGINSTAESISVQKTEIKAENKKETTSKYAQIKKWAKDNKNLLLAAGGTVICICAYYFFSTKTGNNNLLPSGGELFESKKSVSSNSETLVPLENADLYTGFLEQLNNDEN